MTLTELADRVGVTVVNLSVLKNGRARAIRFSTLAASARSSTANPATCSATSDSRSAHSAHADIAPSKTPRPKGAKRRLNVAPNLVASPPPLRPLILACHNG